MGSGGNSKPSTYKKHCELEATDLQGQAGRELESRSEARRGCGKSTNTRALLVAPPLPPFVALNKPPSLGDGSPSVKQTQG